MHNAALLLLAYAIFGIGPLCVVRLWFKISAVSLATLAIVVLPGAKTPISLERDEYVAAKTNIRGQSQGAV